MAKWSRAAALLVLLTAACSPGSLIAIPTSSLAPTATSPAATTPAATTPTTTAPTTTAAPGTGMAARSPLPYAHTGADELTGAAVHAKRLVYVPNQLAGTLEIIDPDTLRVLRQVPVPVSPEHVVPSWDLRTLWVNSDQGNAVTPIDPVTGKVGTPIRVADPYNLYFTPDGAHALAMASRLRRIDVLDPHTMRLQHSLRIPECAGVNHADYTPDLQWMLASCEFNGRVLVIDREATRVVKVLDLNPIRTAGATSPTMAHSMPGPKQGLAPGASAMPQDVRLTPDGRWFMVADMLRNGVWFIDAHTFTVDHFVHTGLGAHGIYPSRDATRVFVSNRDEGTISVFDATTNRPVAKWQLPGPASPDMGGVSADGSQLWLSGRYDSEVYVIDTNTGKLLHRIPTGAGPHGLCVWPQPGRFSLGHTGNLR